MPLFVCVFYFDTSYKGWKLGLNDRAIMANAYFDTSYKGWKQVQKAWLSNKSWYFDTSYKGWKPEKTLHTLNSRIDFDTSYKGWKLRMAIAIRITFNISILPIRDGNMFAIDQLL